MTPDTITPMTATTGRLPRGPAGTWAYEVKWDGVRALATVRDGGLRLRSRPRGNGAGNDVTGRYPELAELAGVRLGALGDGPYVLDGEVVLFDDDGRPSFPLLQHRMHVADPSEARRLAAERSVVYVAFDLLWTPAGPCWDLTYDERRRLLGELDLPGRHVHVPPAIVDDPDPFVDMCRARGLEGVVAKRRAGRYRPGRRTDSWIKVKFTRRQEFVVVGWTEGTGGRSAYLGALMLGVHDEDGVLVYCGKDRTGFSDSELRALDGVLAPLERDEPTVTGAPTQRTVVHWVEPSVVVQVTFGEWSPSGHLRHPSYEGRRDDVDPRRVVREPGPGGDAA